MFWIRIQWNPDPANTFRIRSVDPDSPKPDLDPEGRWIRFRIRNTGFDKQSGSEFRFMAVSGFGLNINGAETRVVFYLFLIIIGESVWIRIRTEAQCGTWFRILTMRISITDFFSTLFNFKNFQVRIH